MDRLRNDERFSQQGLHELTRKAQSKLTAKQFSQLSQEDLARFLVAREGNVAAAWNQLQSAVQWHEKTLGEKNDCPLCMKNPTSHSHIPIGVAEGKESSSILYGCPARATHTAVDPIILHVSLQLEYCFALPPTITGSRWIWCVDYNGFGLKEAMQGKLAAKFGTLFNHHMPERLHKILLLNPPSVFKILLQAAKPFVDQRTLDKIIPVTGSLQDVLQILRDDHDFPLATLQWLEPTLQQSLPADLPPLPSISRQLLLPSLMSKFQFCRPITSQDGDPVPIEEGDPIPQQSQKNARQLVRTTSLLKGQIINMSMDHQQDYQRMDNAIIVMQ